MPMSDRPRPTWRRKLRRIALLLVTTYGIYLAVGLFAQQFFLFPRYLVPVSSAKGAPDGVESFWIESDGARVEAWFIPGAGCTADAPGPLLVHAHGNGESIELWHHPMTLLTSQGINVLMVEYRGYGNSTGSPSQHAITEDFVAAIDKVIDRPGIDPDRLVYFGFSIGGGVVCSVARQREPAGLILLNTFTSLRDLSWRFAFPPFLLRDSFNNAEFIEQYDGPVLIIHSENDQLVPPHHGQALRDKAENGKLLGLTAGHDNFDPASPDLIARIVRFLRNRQLLTDAD